jgi:proteasome lid subunit RPN8/RPN11
VHGKYPNEIYPAILERRRLHDRAYRAQQRDQSEVCGALMATRFGVLRLHFLENQSERPGHFEIASDEVRALRQRQNGTGLRFFGTFHSHPLTYAIPGQGDIRATPTGELMLIYDVCGGEARLWRIVRRKGYKTAVQLTLYIVARSGNVVTAPNKPLNPPAVRMKAAARKPHATRAAG